LEDKPWRQFVQKCRRLKINVNIESSGCLILWLEDIQYVLNTVHDVVSAIVQPCDLSRVRSRTHCGTISLRHIYEITTIYTFARETGCCWIAVG
jgi:hypothetical protein